MKTIRLIAATVSMVAAFPMGLRFAETVHQFSGIVVCMTMIGIVLLTWEETR